MKIDFCARPAAMDGNWNNKKTRPAEKGNWGKGENADAKATCQETKNEINQTKKTEKQEKKENNLGKEEQNPKQMPPIVIRDNGRDPLWLQCATLFAFLPCSLI